MIRKLLDGYNCSVLAYGQTGSGKTFTMEGGLGSEHSTYGRSSKGPPQVGQASQGCAASIDSVDATTRVEYLGIIPRAIHTVFRDGDAGGNRRFWVYVSHMEIYNERLFDLLACDDVPNTFESQHPERHPSPRSDAISPARHVPTTPSRSRSPLRTQAGGDRGRERCRGSPSLSPQRENPKNWYQKHDRYPTGAGGRCLRSPNVGKSSERRHHTPRGLTIEEDPEFGITIKGLTQIQVKSPEEIFAIISRSKSNRRTAEVKCLERLVGHSSWVCMCRA